MSKVLFYPEDNKAISECVEYCNVVFTNGCFDIFHQGHLRVLSRCVEIAENTGALVVVGVNSDSSVAKLKGHERPVFSHSHRAKLISMLRGISLAVVYEDDTPERLIELVNPFVVVKGGDYEESAVISAGRKVEIVPYMPGISTTSIIDQLRKI